jgi:hypothetical protein
MLDNIHKSLHLEAERIYKNLDNKIPRLTNLQHEKLDEKFEFYSRVINQTDIVFVFTVLSRYDFSHKNKYWIRKIALEAENAITLLPTEEQDYMRHQVAKQIQELQTQQITSCANNHKNHSTEVKILNHIKEKLHRHEAMITKADRGNSTVILRILKTTNKKC